MPRTQGQESTAKTVEGTFVADGRPLPRGQYGDLVVAYFDESATGWILLAVTNLNIAEAKFREAMCRPSVRRVRLKAGMHAGRDSAIAWIARCDGERSWVALAGTQGFWQEYSDRWPRMPDRIHI